MTAAHLSLPLPPPPRGSASVVTAAAAPFVPSARWAPAPARRGAALLVLALHLLALALLWQAGRHVVAKIQTPALAVSLLPADAPPAAAPRPAMPRTELPSLPVSPAPVPPLPEFTPAAATRETNASPPPPAAAVAATEAAPIRAVAAPPPGPKPVAAGSLRYRVEPAVEVPRLSRRAGEHGRVLLRVVFDTEGRPRDIQLLRSSGFARLDAQAREAMQAARIAPYLEDGRAIEVVAQATLEYELE
ncbi:energy transducer TonB [Inhella crocodyli]|uniref:Energy transducer TonB n=1 Tax=Inhella crocodyli TaxID=2499851 RepID=A0A3S2UL63_9BURK|nr:energy transducer TonB [Inhella crocodyli]RVT88781.1 energy transducer TonB [Inhella crocodyli]